MAFPNADLMPRSQKVRFLFSLLFFYVFVCVFTFEVLEINKEMKKKNEKREIEDKLLEHLWKLSNSYEVLNKSCWSENATALDILKST